VLQPQSPAAHNKMLGQRIPHPQSTKFEDQGFELPTAKRLKRERSTDSLSRDVSEEESLHNISPAAGSHRREIPDSEAEDSEDERPPVASQTDLESALPQVKTDKDAIAEYETARAAEAIVPDLQERLGQRKWIIGKSSIYVDAFNLALETVLKDEGHLFDEAEMGVFEAWRSLTYEAQYLYVRLFLRKTAAWHRINGLGYYSDIGDMDTAIEDLMLSRDLPESSAKAQSNPGEFEPPTDATLGSSFTFADASAEHISTLEEASKLLKLDELKAIAKDAKIQGKNKQELLHALRRTSGKQTGLGWGLKRSETEESIKSEVSTTSLDPAENRDTHFTSKILASTGPCIRLSSPPLKLFERVHLVFYRSTEWTEKSLTTIILARISRRNFPEYMVSRSANIFPSRSMLLEFEASIRTQFRVDFMLENGTTTKEVLQKVQDIFDVVYPRWKALVKEEQYKEDRVYESGEGAYLRRFSPAWVYTRICHKGLQPLARFKEHKQEHSLLTELLGQRLFHAARRGAWYQRKALLEEHYMWALEPNNGRSEELQKKQWKRTALQTCEEGLQDKECHLIFHFDLQKRVMKLEKSLKIAKRFQHDFGHVLLARPKERFVEGIRIERDVLPNGRRASDAGNRRGAKTIWIDELDTGGECSVEEMCLSWYRNQGWKGYHSEGRIVRVLFGYLFYDILFIYIPNVFQTPYQTCPLDLHTDAFFPTRLSEINHRLVEIQNGGAERIVREVHAAQSERQTCVIGIDWTYELDDLLEIVSCFRPEGLAAICKVMAQEYQQRGGGIPDLFLWHPDNREVMFVEVKSENDRLSDTQRLWIHVLTGAGIKVELCNAVAREVRRE
jgi:Fanconi-associated nuclease 1